MSFNVQNLFSVRRDWEIYSAVEDGVIIVRARPHGARDGSGELIQGTEITRLHWRGHLYEPAVPVHYAILDMIGRRMADLVRDGLAHGYLHAQLDIRKALGL
ncbi:hypothetical protein [Methylobacterium sp. SI9]|uniref:hypothetical protein n=1 Tax=Methylobacterium guangdongense TaxID=3138811 RepID=UPI00313C0341